MAHYAIIDTTDNRVVHVMTGVDENITQIDIDGTEVGGSSEAWEAFYLAKFNIPYHNPNYICKRTSYNGNIRGVYAGVGYAYDPVLDVFVIPPIPEIVSPPV
jgi:hypothetical protein